jgi:hypothetical protein
MVEIIALFCMVMTSCMDPGYLPRRNFMKIVKSDNVDMTVDEHGIPFFSHYMYTKGHSVKLKY